MDFGVKEVGRLLGGSGNFPQKRQESLGGITTEVIEEEDDDESISG